MFDLLALYLKFERYCQMAAPAYTNAINTFTSSNTFLGATTFSNTVACTSTLTAATLSATVSVVAPAFTSLGTVSAFGLIEGGTFSAAGAITGGSLSIYGTASAPTFSGTTLTLTGSAAVPTYTGTSMVLTGNASASTFGGTAMTLTGTGSAVTFSATSGVFTTSTSTPLSLTNEVRLGTSARVLPLSTTTTANAVSSAVCTNTKEIFVGATDTGTTPAASTFYRVKAYDTQSFGVVLAAPQVVHSEVADSTYHNVGKVGLTWSPNKGFWTTGASAAVATSSLVMASAGTPTIHDVSAWEAYGGAFQVVNYVPWSFGGATAVAAKVAFRMVIGSQGSCYLVRQVTSLKASTNPGTTSATYSRVLTSHTIFE